MEQKYYFISYAWIRPQYTKWEYTEDITDEFPIQWLINVRKMITESESDESYALISWNEITKEQYDKYKDLVG